MRGEDCFPQTARGRTGLKDNTSVNSEQTMQHITARSFPHTYKRVEGQRNTTSCQCPHTVHCADLVAIAVVSDYRLQWASVWWEKCPDGGHRLICDTALTDSSAERWWVWVIGARKKATTGLTLAGSWNDSHDAAKSLKLIRHKQDYATFEVLLCKEIRCQFTIKEVNNWFVSCSASSDWVSVLHFHSDAKIVIFAGCGC